MIKCIFPNIMHMFGDLYQPRVKQRTMNIFNNNKI